MKSHVAIQDDIDRKGKQSWTHLSWLPFEAGLWVLYLLLFIGLYVAYKVTRCKFESESECVRLNSVEFGGTCPALCRERQQPGPGEKASQMPCLRPSVETITDCEQFVIDEECYCKKCTLCIQNNQRRHCMKSRAERLKVCRSQFGEKEEEWKKGISTHITLQLYYITLFFRLPFLLV